MRPAVVLTLPVNIQKAVALRLASGSRQSPHYRVPSYSESGYSLFFQNRRGTNAVRLASDCFPSYSGARPPDVALAFCFSP